jgi:hypothetical protein
MYIFKFIVDDDDDDDNNSDRFIEMTMNMIYFDDDSNDNILNIFRNKCHF